MQSRLNIILRLSVVAVILSFAIGFQLGRKGVKVETKTDVQIQTRERVVTKIKELPDGSKTTLIVENRAAKTDLSVVQRKDPLLMWRIDAIRRFNPVGGYTLGVGYRILPRAFISVYGGPDRYLGVGASFEF